MARHENFDWNMPEGTPDGKGNNNHSWESIYVSLLMDIRDELQSLNRLLHCRRFIEIPWKLDAIVRNTTKKKPKLKVVKKKESEPRADRRKEIMR